jgi:CheY-like chemotaxis protein
MKKILIVDDDSDFAEATKDVLESKGYTVVTAPDGKRGFAAAKKEKPDLMLLDVMMTTDTEGFDIARQLKQDSATAKLPVIMITGIRKAKSLPFKFEPDEDWLPVKAVMEKPIKPEVLLKSVAEALG